MRVLHTEEPHGPEAHARGDRPQAPPGEQLIAAGKSITARSACSQIAPCWHTRSIASATTASRSTRPRSGSHRWLEGSAKATTPSAAARSRHSARSPSTSKPRLPCSAPAPEPERRIELLTYALRVRCSAV